MSNIDFITIEKGIRDVIWKIDFRTKRIYFSKKWHKLTGYDFQVNGYTVISIIKLIHFEDVKNVISVFNHCINTKNENVKIQFRIRVKTCSYKWILVKGIIDFNEVDSELTFAGGSITDLTYQKKLEEKIEYLSYVDKITNLNNLNYFEKNLAKYIMESKSVSNDAALLYINISGFQKINDTYGLNVGNELLKTIGAILRNSVKQSDIVSRIHGDEFVILLADMVQENDVVRFVERIINIFKEPVDVFEKKLYVNLFIGITWLHNNSIPELIRRGHVAAYTARKLGMNNYAFYEKVSNERVIRNFRIKNDLRDAIENQELILYYQPKIHVKTGKICGLEALIRWQHPIKGIIPPNEFIPLAEESDLIVNIGKWVLKTVCFQIKEWQEKGIGNFPIAVNISPRQLQKDNFVKDVMELLKETGLEAKFLEFEITEGTMIKSMDRTIDLINELRNIGIKVSLDDFGTSYSSLNYLRKLPIDKIKIDRSFIKDLDQEENVEAVLSAIILLSKKMKLEIVAEGVETFKQLDFLIEQGCEQVQGYLFSKPKPVLEIEEVLFKGTIQVERDEWFHYMI
jgi:diguanylate cyclase (GGDEF)-like protein